MLNVTVEKKPDAPINPEDALNGEVALIYIPIRDISSPMAKHIAGLWVRTNDIDLIASSADVVFAIDADDESILEAVATRYPEEKESPFTSLRFDRQYRDITINTNKTVKSRHKHITVLNEPELKNVSMFIQSDESVRLLADLLKKAESSISAKGLARAMVDYPYSVHDWDRAAEAREKMYAAGITMNLVSGTIEFNPQKAKRQLSRFRQHHRNFIERKTGCAAGGKKIARTRKPSFPDFKNLLFGMEELIGKAVGKTGFEIRFYRFRPTWATISPALRIAASAVNGLYVKGAYRSLPEWVYLKRHWHNLTAKRRKAIGEDFTAWMEREFKMRPPK